MQMNGRLSVDDIINEIDNCFSLKDKIILLQNIFAKTDIFLYSEQDKIYSRLEPSKISKFDNTIEIKL